ncbi:siderophore-interacting protein [Corynebacterium sp. CCM 9185]|uniref:Siderophore-interacting protein n=1 Tax=Corynebacterium marambiense TaxID=2765364 RepID=A0ABS0VWY8_9CORY|nr:siderophore-interacting protein [Corynebacterium marambiense]MBI8999862.1 siderophore-interacting protein [Corynebacterium marambiense]MCK7662700.1 siderophore-interacting protein [Corynebacterium marambiense]MCX7543711.1 siderophore-interacting protein [Corynebacterium marambiense]
MSWKNTLYLTTMKTMSAVMRRTMAMPTDPRIREELVRATIADATLLAPHLRRITLSAPEFKGLESAGPDEYVALIMPQPGKQLTMPDPTIINPRAALAAVDDDVRPSMRYYTIRELRPRTGEMVIDIVTHGDSGPGSVWAIGAEKGDEVGVRFLSAAYRLPTGPQLLVADATAVPALSAIIESLDEPARAQTHAIVIAESDDLLDPGLDGIVSGIASYTRLTDPLADAPRAGIAAIDTLPVDVGDLTYAWICGEQSIATSLRRHLTKECGMDRKTIFFSGYWRLGKERG